MFGLKYPLAYSYGRGIDMLDLNDVQAATLHRLMEKDVAAATDVYSFSRSSESTLARRQKRG